MARRKKTHEETENVTDYTVELSFNHTREVMFIKINGEEVDCVQLAAGQKVKILIGRKVRKKEEVKPLYEKLA